jgi:hypothetical protein
VLPESDDVPARELLAARKVVRRAPIGRRDRRGRNICKIVDDLEHGHFCAGAEPRRECSAMAR